MKFLPTLTYHIIYEKKANYFDACVFFLCSLVFFKHSYIYILLVIKIFWSKSVLMLYLSLMHTYIDIPTYSAIVWIGREGWDLGRVGWDLGRGRCVT